MPLQLGGLASGVDTETVVAQLMALERRPQLKLKLKQRQIETRQNALRDVATRLRNLKTAADALKSTTTWVPTQKVDTSDATKATVVRLGNAGPGGYSLTVSQLARAEQRTYLYTTNPAATTMTIDGTTVNIGANATLQQAVDAINSTSGIAVYATAVGTGPSERLVLSHKATGASTLSASGATIAEESGTAILGQDASYSLDGGTPKTSATNVLTNAVAGLEITLKGVTPTGAPVTINVGPAEPDKAAIEAKVKAFVDQYNSTIEFINSKLDEKRVVEPKTDDDYNKGVLRGDTMLRGLLERLRSSLINPVAGNPTTLDELREVGISTGATTGGASAVNQDAVKGKLVLDSVKLQSALTTDLTSVKNLFGAGALGDGLALRFDAQLDPATRTGGQLDDRIGDAGKEVTRVRDQLTALDKRLAQKEKLLRAQFERMEDAFARSQQQGSWLAAQLSGGG